MVEQIEQKHKQHTMYMENRATLHLTGVEDVIRATEKEVYVKTCKGALQIKGENLHVEKLDVATGELNVNGLVTAFVYSGGKSKKSFFKRLFQ